MLSAKVVCNKKYLVGEIDKRIYGSFLEHMGRVIYSGIYEPNHKEADKEGFRRDVLQKTMDMGVTTVRYPGGNFVSAYHWEDGVGPKEKRPRRIDLAWRAVETNEFGTNEFMKWVHKADITPVMTVNLGTRGIEEAVNYVEYCNFQKGTKYSDMRREHGAEEPYRIKMWCLGNEMDGEWQVGHKTAYEYGRLAAETGKAMKLIDPEIELIACGSSLSSMGTFPDWDLEVLEQTYEIIDYLALHQYYGGQEMGTQAFLAQALDMEEYIKTARSVAQVIKHKLRSRKDMKFSIDEWGVWSTPGDTVNREVNENPWQVAPAISEQIYSMEDALLFASMQMVMLRNADVIKIACQALLTNVSACIMTEKGGGVWLQTTYYPFYCFAHFARGVTLESRITGPGYECGTAGNVPYIDAVTVWNQEKEEVILFAVNRNETESIEVEWRLEGFYPKSIISFIRLHAGDRKMTNQYDHEAVLPEETDGGTVEGEYCTVEMLPLSFNMVRIAV